MITNNSDSYVEKVLGWNESPMWILGTDILLKRIIGCKSLLDVGCGVGSFVAKASRYYPRMNVIGSDVNPEMIAIARKNIGYDFRLQEAEVLPFSTGQFDCVTVFHVMQQVDDYIAMIREIHRVLKPNGMALFAISNLWYDALMFPYNLYSGYKGDRTIKHFWTPTQFKLLIEEACFSSVNIEMFGESKKFFSWLNIQPWTIYRVIK